MNTKIKVSKLTGNRIVVANSENKFSEVQKLFTEFNIHHLPVVNNGILVGIISSTDLMKWYAKNAHKLERIDQEAIDGAISIEELMTQNPVTVSPGDNLSEAIELLATRKFQALPIVENGRVIGMITTRDIVKYFNGEIKADADSIF